MHLRPKNIKQKPNIFLGLTNINLIFIVSTKNKKLYKNNVEICNKKIVDISPKNYIIKIVSFKVIRRKVFFVFSKKEKIIKKGA